MCTFFNIYCTCSVYVRNIICYLFILNNQTNLNNSSIHASINMPPYTRVFRILSSTSKTTLTVRNASRRFSTSTSTMAGHRIERDTFGKILCRACFVANRLKGRFDLFFLPELLYPANKHQTLQVNLKFRTRSTMERKR